jgi:hypothetical protein
MRAFGFRNADEPVRLWYSLPRGSRNKDQHERHRGGDVVFAEREVRWRIPGVVAGVGAQGKIDRPERTPSVRRRDLPHSSGQEQLSLPLTQRAVGVLPCDFGHGRCTTPGWKRHDRSWRRVPFRTGPTSPKLPMTALRILFSTWWRTIRLVNRAIIRTAGNGWCSPPKCGSSAPSPWTILTARNKAAQGRAEFDRAALAWYSSGVVWW